MHPEDKNNNKGIQRKTHWLIRVAARYRVTPFAIFLRAFEPAGILVAAIGLAATAWILKLTLDQIEEIQKTREAAADEIKAARLSREATLFGILFERLETARARYHEQKMDNERLKPAIQSGQVQILERMASLEIPLQGIDASEVALAYVELPCAEVKSSNFTYSMLTRINLRNARVDGTDFSGANLANARFDGAHISNSIFRQSDLTSASFEGTVLYNVDLTLARNLNQWQAEKACGRLVTAPKGWEIRHCGEDPERKLRCSGAVSYQHGTVHKRRHPRVGIPGGFPRAKRTHAKDQLSVDEGKMVSESRIRAIRMSDSMNNDWKPGGAKE